MMHMQRALEAQGAGVIDAGYVQSRLEDAGMTLLALPSNAPRLGAQVATYGFASLVASDDAKGRRNRLAPSMAAITRMDEAATWFALIPDSKGIIRRIVALRSLVKPDGGKHLHPWRAIGATLGCSHQAVVGWHAEGIAIIVRALRRRLPR